MGRYCAQWRKGSAVPPQAAEPSPLLDSLVAYWAMEELSGARSDKVGTSNLTPFGEPIQVEGRIGNAVQTSPTTSDYLATNSVPALRLGGTDWTLQAWVFLDSVSEQGIAGKWQSGSKEYLLKCGASELAIVVSTNGLSTSTLLSSLLVEGATWYHVLAWFDNTSKTLYISTNNEAPTSLLISGTVFSANSDFEVGREAVAETYFAGRVDELAIWKRLLTPGERASLYNSGLGLAYPFS